MLGYDLFRCRFPRSGFAPLVFPTLWTAVWTLVGATPLASSTSPGYCLLDWAPLVQLASVLGVQVTRRPAVVIRCLHSNGGLLHALQQRPVMRQCPWHLRDALAIRGSLKPATTIVCAQGLNFLNAWVAVVLEAIVAPITMRHHYTSIACAARGRNIRGGRFAF